MASSEEQFRTLDNLAESFVKAVNARRSLSEEVLQATTQFESFALLGAMMKPGTDGRAIPTADPYIENFLYIAEIYTKAAARIGKSEELKSSIPDSAYTSDGRQSLHSVLADKFPNFVALCSSETARKPPFLPT